MYQILSNSDIYLIVFIHIAHPYRGECWGMECQYSVGLLICAAGSPTEGKGVGPIQLISCTNEDVGAWDGPPSDPAYLQDPVLLVSGLAPVTESTCILSRLESCFVVALMSNFPPDMGFRHLPVLQYLAESPFANHKY